MSHPKIYTVNGPSSTSSPSLPSWLTTKPRSTRTATGAKKRSKTQRTLGSLELIQDFTFPEAAIRIKTTPDGLHAIGTGCYKPMIKVWDLEQLTVKFERVTEAENVDFAVSQYDSGSVVRQLTADHLERLDEDAASAAGSFARAAHARWSAPLNTTADVRADTRISWTVGRCARGLYRY